MEGSERDGRATAIAGGSEKVVGEVGMRAVPRLRRVHWSKEASGLRFVFPYWSTPAIKVICHWIIETMVEAIIR